MLTYLLGPILALLPRTWRKLLPFDSGVDWRRATLLSGFGEAVVALVSLMYWYSDYMALLVNNGVDSAITGKMGPRVTDQEIGFTALVIWATHPLTWVITFAGVEGAVRLVSAAFTETNPGTFPLFVPDKIVRKLSRRSRQSAAEAAGYSESNISSYMGAIREKAYYKRLPEVPDELSFSGSFPDEFLEIRASRKKAEWIPPRPFCYTLRKLPAGVMGRTVLVYSPGEEPVFAKK